MSHKINYSRLFLAILTLAIVDLIYGVFVSPFFVEVRTANHRVLVEMRLISSFLELRPQQLGPEPRILQVLHVHILLPRPLRAPRPHTGKLLGHFRTSKEPYV